MGWTLSNTVIFPDRTFVSVAPFRSTPVTFVNAIFALRRSAPVARTYGPIMQPCADVELYTYR